MSLENILIPTSNAEVDFIIEHHGQVIPIEVKSSAKGHLKSLHLYLNSHPRASCGVRISEIELSKHNHILNIPLYGIESFLKSDL